MKIYVSGQITGLDRKEVEIKFQSAKDKITLIGFDCITPLEICPFNKDYTWNDYMIEDIKGLFECDGIYMLRDWQESVGARIELAIAKELGLQIFYEDAILNT